MSLCGVAGLWVWVAGVSMGCGCVMLDDMGHKFDFV